ncbi:hypothetical protein [Lysinibacillus sp. NPDC059133]|uniref:hypothetical protein n=1 Tax=Lysinibacillus sp. NPDC059133 TaxID=3346737 RepID=UPI0036B6E525
MFISDVINFFQQMFFVPKAKLQVQVSFVTIVKRQVQKSPTSTGGEMNADLSYFSAGVQTPAEKEEPRLRPLHPVKTPE